METDSKPWQCEYCTFMNEATWLVCGMCLQECKKTNTNGYTLDFPVIDPDDVIGLDAAPEYHVQPTVAAVSAAAAVTTNASKVFIQPIPDVTVANSSTSRIAAVSSPTIVAHAAGNITQNAGGATATAYTPYTTAYPVSTAGSIPFARHSVKNIISSTLNNIAEVKYTPLNAIPVTTSAKLVGNGATFNTTRRLAQVNVPVTVAVTQSNTHVPRVRVINPKSNPSYFNLNSAFTVTSTATSVPVSNSYNNSYNGGLQSSPLQQTELFRPFTTYNANASNRPFTMPIFTPTTLYGSNSYTSGAQLARSRRTETPLTFPSHAGASTITPHASSSPVASCSFTPYGRGAQPGIPNPHTLAPQQPLLNSATQSFPFGPPVLPATLKNAPVTVTTSSGPNAPPVTSASTFNGAARVTTAAFAAALATDRTPGWMCSYCTFINDNLLLRCAVCDTKKPENLPKPDINPNVINDAYFECPQCYLLYTESDGMVLVNCGHKFCKNCLRDWISYSAELQLKCPFKIRGVLCNRLLTNQEIGSILNSEYVAIDNTKVITARSTHQNVIPGPPQQNIVAGPSQANVGPVSLPQNIVPGSSQQNIATGPSQANIDRKSIPQNVVPGPSRPINPANLGLIDLCSDSEEETNNAVNIPPTAAGINPPAKIGNEINYQELLELEKEVLIPNLEFFECTICMTEQNPGEGVVMRECLHMFCRDCLKQAIKCNTDAEMKCLFGDGKTRCESTLQDREIRALVDAVDFEKHLSRSIKEAENKIQNTFHCKTVDCVGWCEYEEEVTEFTCPVCSKTNCINCKAIHTGQDCKQYQINIQLNSAKNPEDAKTNKMLQAMLKNGTAMYCPKCAIILSKVSGCDWLRCSMCKTEICWVTRGPRWGPKGIGDISGGCRCRLNGKFCHPKCGNCH